MYIHIQIHINIDNVLYISNLVMHAVVKQSKQILPLMGSHIKMWMHSSKTFQPMLNYTIMESRFMHTHS